MRVTRRQRRIHLVAWIVLGPMILAIVVAAALDRPQRAVERAP